VKFTADVVACATVGVDEDGADVVGTTEATGVSGDEDGDPRPDLRGCGSRLGALSPTKALAP